MGKNIIVKNADFSRNSIGKIFDLNKSKKYDCSVGNDTAGWFYKGKHVLLDVSPGQAYFLKAKNVEEGYVGILSSAHTEPVSSGQQISYSPSAPHRIKITQGEYYKLIIPDDDVKYLAINVVDGSGASVDWDVYMMFE